MMLALKYFSTTMTTSANQYYTFHLMELCQMGPINSLVSEHTINRKIFLGDKRFLQTDRKKSSYTTEIWKQLSTTCKWTS